MIELNGSLGGIGLPALIKLLSDLHETGVLRIGDGNWSGELDFLNGHLIAASMGNARGMDALSACVLLLGDGEFGFHEARVDVERNLDLADDELRDRLADLLSQQTTPTAALPPLDLVPQPAAHGAETPEQLVLDRTSVQILMLVDGRRTVREIIADRPVVPVLHSLAQLAQQGLIVLPDAIAAPATPPTRQRLSPQPRPAPVPPPVTPPEPATPVAAQPVRRAPITVEAAPPEPPAEPGGILTTCPKLGFADDPGRHYARPTALHRCYASDQPSLVSSQEQRDLCLGGRYATCPRFRAADDSPAAAVPPGVAARLALASNMSMPGQPAEAGLPAWVGPTEPPKRAPTPTSAPRRPIHLRPPLLVAGGALVGLLLLVGALMVLPLLQPGLATTPTPGAPTTAPVVTRAAAPTTVAAPTAAKPVIPPTSIPTAPPSLPTPTTQTLPNALLDARFTAGPQKGWLENPPFAGWRDGAYRFVARQATHFVAIAAPAPTQDDVIVSATLRKTGGPPGGGYGIIVRNQTAEGLDGTNQSFDGYVLEAGDLGEFGIWRRDGDRWIDLVPWTRSQAVRQGGSPNDLIVKAQETQLLFTINGIEVARVDDDALAHGGVGVFVGGDLNEVALDRFTVQNP